jgi:hypothetical protein
MPGSLPAACSPAGSHSPHTPPPHSILAPLQAEVRAACAEDQLASYQKALHAAQREVEALAAANRHTHSELLTATSWAELLGPPE